MRFRKAALTAFAVLALICSGARAQSSSGGSGWTGTLGAGPLFVEKYIGGNELQALPLPIAYVTYDEWFYVNLFRAGAYFWGSEDKKRGIGFALEPRLGFHSSDGAKLAGMATRRGSLSAGITYDWQGESTALSVGRFADLSHASGGGYWDLLVDRTFAHNERWDVSGTLEFSRLDAKVVNYYFGVTPDEANAARPAYEPGATNNVTVWLTGQYNLSKQHALMFGANLTRLGGAAAASPIVERRTAPLAYFGYGLNL
jgi:outer membrane protein